LDIGCSECSLLTSRFTRFNGADLSLHLDLLTFYGLYRHDFQTQYFLNHDTIS